MTSSSSSGLSARWWSNMNSEYEADQDEDEEQRRDHPFFLINQAIGLPGQLKVLPKPS